MSDIVDCTFEVEQFATIAQLKSVIEEMRDLMEEVRDLVLKRDRQKASGTWPPYEICAVLIMLNAKTRCYRCSCPGTGIKSMT